MSENKTIPLSYPYKNEKLLLLSCCAPCSVEIIKRLADNNVDKTVLFYNPNIHPKLEYMHRKQQNKEVCDKYGLKFIDLDYNVKNWFNVIKGLEKEPERGQRCAKCFDYRLVKTAEYALENGFNVISSTLAASRWKDLNQIENIAKSIEQRYPNLKYWYLDLRKKGAQDQRLNLIKENNLYEQNYCGCIYSKINK
jgi:predicted adenine nucleotide alpha hydrolase (AANH) superfamily ATPase